MKKICPGRSKKVRTCPKVRNLFQYLDPSREVREYHGGGSDSWVKRGECGHTLHSGLIPGRFHVAGIGHDIAPNDPTDDDSERFDEPEDPAIINRNEDGCTYAYCAKRV